MKNIVTINIEIPKNSKIKYEYNRKTKKIEVDRILRDNFEYPCNYGFIPNTIDWDGDELDVLLFSEETFTPGVSLRARIVGAMQMIDSGETDTKIIAVHADDYRHDQIKTLNDLPKDFLEQIKTFFSKYKNWKGVGITSVRDFKDTTWALEELNECFDLFKKHSSLSKEDFISLMKKNHPEKYE